MNKYIILRYFCEKIVAIILLILLSPVLVLVAILIKSDGGPAFFFQKRVGQHSKIFAIYKFRTMIVDADEYLDSKGTPTKKRVTKIGQILRKTSIDEIPQLLNIVKGDMSFIGPRPILPRMLPYMSIDERKRFSLKPGITGLAQVNGRNNLVWSKRFKLDCEYSSNVSLKADFEILLKTIVTLFNPSLISDDRNLLHVDDITVRPLDSLNQHRT